jgi:hypothetical protein
MKTFRNFARALLVTSAFGAAVFGGINLTAPRAEAVAPILLCGPTILWSCSGPGGPDILFAGTVCERLIFERRNGVTCVPYGG